MIITKVPVKIHEVELLQPITYRIALIHSHCFALRNGLERPPCVHFFVSLPGIIIISGVGLRKLTDREIEELINALHDEPCLWLTSSPAFSNGFILVLLQCNHR